MGAEENRKLTMRFYDEVINGRDLELFDTLVADDFVEHEMMPGMPEGKAAPRAMMEMLWAGFPDIRFSAEGVVAEDDIVAVRGRMTGTHTGTFLDIPATGKAIDVQFMDFIRIRDGKAVEHWGVTDASAMMEQLGMMEPPGA